MPLNNDNDKTTRACKTSPRNNCSSFGVTKEISGTFCLTLLDTISKQAILCQCWQNGNVNSSSYEALSNNWKEKIVKQY